MVNQRARHLGAGIASAVTQNFGTVPGITVSLRSATSPYGTRRTDHAAINRELGATHILDMTLAAITPAPKVFGRLYRSGERPEPVWEGTLSGDPLAIETSLFDQLGRTLESDVRRFTNEEWAQLRRVPYSTQWHRVYRLLEAWWLTDSFAGRRGLHHHAPRTSDGRRSGFCDCVGGSR